MKEEITNQKKLFEVKKMWQQRTRELRFFYFTDFEQFLLAEWFRLFFLFFINY